MRQTENINKEELSLIGAKLQKDYDKLLKKSPNKTKVSQKVVDGLTIGTRENEKVFLTSLVAPGVPFALGVSKALIGTVALIPSITSGAPNIDAVPFFEEAANYGRNMLNSSQDNLTTMIPLLMIPAGVAAISMSMKIYEMISKKRENKKYENNQVVKLIDDVIAGKEDKSLEFAYKFFKRVDLSKIDPKSKLELLKYITYYRYMLQKEEKNEVTKEDAEEAYDQMIQYFKYLKESKNCSEEFKTNRFIRILIDEYDEKIRVENILSGVPTR